MSIYEIFKDKSVRYKPEKRSRHIISTGFRSMNRENKVSNKDKVWSCYKKLNAEDAFLIALSAEVYDDGF